MKIKCKHEKVNIHPDKISLENGKIKIEDIWASATASCKKCNAPIALEDVHLWEKNKVFVAIPEWYLQQIENDTKHI